MATKAFIQNPNYMKHVAILGDSVNTSHNLLHPSHQSFGHVSLPKNPNSSIFSSKRSLIASSSSSSSLLAPPPSINTPNPTSTRISTPYSRTLPSVVSSDSTLNTLPTPVSRIWKEIQGCNNWENLIEPLNPLLKQEITKYGNLVTACYKAFDLDPNSKRFLNCKFGKKTLLKQAGIENADGYHVTKYIYAVPDVTINIPIHSDPNRGRWVGYVAVSSDDSMKRLGRRDIVVTFRGTVTNPEWVANFMSSLTPARLDPHDQRQDVKVESGFLSLYTSDENQSRFGLESCRQQLLSEISRLINKYKDEEMSITLAGHSMGSSLAHLLAYDISELGLNRRSMAAAGGDNNVIPVTVFSFAGPRVGNFGFKERCEELGVKVLRIVNVNDPITKLPGVLFNEKLGGLGGKFELPWSCSCYVHVGVELVLDFFNVQNPTCVHDLETYINLLNRPRRSAKSQSQSQLSDDSDGGKYQNLIKMDFLNRSSQMMMFSQKSLQWKIAAYNVVNLLGSVSNHMLYCNIF